MLLVELRTKKLLQRAEKHPMAFKYASRGPIRQFFRGYDYEQMERYDEALEIYDTLLDTLSSENFEQRHIWNAAITRKKEIKQRQFLRSESGISAPTEKAKTKVKTPPDPPVTSQPD